MRKILLPTLLVLAACGTPQQQCISRETRELRVVERLIAETQANLDRGYGFEEVTIFTTEYVDCTPQVIVPPGEPAPEIERRLCLEEVPETVRRPVALDLGAEQRKLDGLLTKRRDLTARAEDAIAACRAAYPEG
ncbi:MAG: hypothetical protein ACRCS3_03570 [Paracoccaceae bacterium]